MAKNKKPRKPTKPETPAESAPGIDPDSRSVVYTQLQSDVRSIVGGNPYTIEEAKDHLGWEEETDGNPFGADFLLKDIYGKKVRCTNNLKNRPFRIVWAKTIAQEHLNRRFAPKGPNGEAIIIGRTGLILSAQHRLIGLILAGQLWEKFRHHWEEFWPEGPPTMDTFISYGVDESSETVRTLDNVCPRHLGDVLYTEDLFAGIKAKERKNILRILQFCLRILWVRTGSSLSQWTGFQTHSESLDFVANHGSVLDSVKLIQELDSKHKGRIGNFLPLGTASALMYLMGTCKSDINVYINNVPRNENVLDWVYWDKAKEFWTLVAKNSATLEPVYQAVRSLIDPSTGKPPSKQERVAIFIKAWDRFSKLGKGEELPTNYKMYLPKFRIDAEEGTRILLEDLSIGGIDQGEYPDKFKEGNPPDRERDDPEDGEDSLDALEDSEDSEDGEPDEDDSEAVDDGLDALNGGELDPDPEELADRATRIREEREERRENRKRVRREKREKEREADRENGREGKPKRRKGKKNFDQDPERFPGDRIRIPSGAPDQTLEQEIDVLKSRSDNRVLFFPMTGGYKLYGEDAHLVGSCLRIPIRSVRGSIDTATVPMERLQEAVDSLKRRGYDSAVEESDDTGRYLRFIESTL